MRIEAGRGGRQKHSTSHRAFPTFPLDSFEALASRYETE